jgi:osmoprotectant transport system ATP-binding protein
VTAAISLQGVGKTFPGAAAPAVSDLSFDVSEGEICVLVGPSGCGKTTTLKMINRLVEPTSGYIYVHGTEVRALPAHELRRGIGYVIQQIGLFPHRTVRDNIATVPRLLGRPEVEIRAAAEEVLRMLGLDGFGPRMPRSLSGGEQQRVGIARAIVAQPSILLCDEPFGALDPIVRRELQDAFRATRARGDATIVFVTHDLPEALRVAERVVVFDHGRVVEDVAASAFAASSNAVAKALVEAARL